MSETKVLECACDASTFLADTVMERYESLYLKVHEVTNILLAKNAEIESLTLRACSLIAKRFANNYGMEEGYIGVCNNTWKVYQDSTIPVGQIKIGSDIGYALLTVLNFQEYMDYQ